MGFWYSRNIKLLFRCKVNSWYRQSGYCYGYVYNGENFKATDGTTGAYLYCYSSDSSDSAALLRARAMIGDCIKLPTTAASGNLKVCLDTNAWDDTRYTYAGQISEVTTAISQSFPGSTIITVTNSAAAPVTFNALVYVYAGGCLSNSDTSSGTLKTLLQYAYLCDSPVTLAAGQTYTVEFTV